VLARRGLAAVVVGRARSIGFVSGGGEVRVGAWYVCRVGAVVVGSARSWATCVGRGGSDVAVGCVLVASGWVVLGSLCESGLRGCMGPSRLWRPRFVLS